MSLTRPVSAAMENRGHGKARKTWPRIARCFMAVIIFAQTPDLKTARNYLASRGHRTSERRLSAAQPTSTWNIIFITDQVSLSEIRFFSIFSFPIFVVKPMIYIYNIVRNGALVSC